MYAYIFAVQSDSLWSHGQQQARLPCLSLSPGVWSNVYIIMVIIMGHLLHKWLSSLLSTICWRLSTAHWNTFHLCLKPIDHIHVDVFLDCLSQGLVNYYLFSKLVNKCGLILVFARKVDYNKAKIIYLHNTYDCFHAAMPELSCEKEAFDLQNLFIFF